MKKIIFTAAIFAALSLGAIAGPLGLTKGMTLEQLQKKGALVEGTQTFTYTAKNLASGHPDFESYMFVVTPEHGLCKVVALGKTINTNVFGADVKSEYESLLNAITAKYGAPSSTFDTLLAGSIWRDPNDWMMGLFKKERNLTSYWTLSTIKNLPDSLQSIMISASGLSPNKGYIHLGYEFDNFDKCKKSIEAKTNANL